LGVILTVLHFSFVVCIIGIIYCQTKVIGIHKSFCKNIGKSPFREISQREFIAA